MIYAYALDHVRGDYQRIASFASGQRALMELSLDGESGDLWAQCDATCGNQLGVLDIDSSGHFRLLGQFERPSQLPNLNNEGLTLAPDLDCQAGVKPVF